MRLFGQDLSETELDERVGRIEQVVSSTMVVEGEGPARGMRRIVVRCGELCFDVHPDRAMDIGSLSYRGIPLTWMSPAGVRSASSRGPSKMRWLDTFSGGLIATCGLDAFGSPSEDQGESFPLHGEIGAEQADQISQDPSMTERGVHELRISGRVRQARLFGPDLELHRTITTRLGSPALDVRDVITNRGATAQEHMILYHLNLGWPLVDQSARLHIPGEEVLPRDQDAAAGLATWDRFDVPAGTVPEQVFRHRLPNSGEFTAALRNARLGVELAVTFDTTELPALFQWKLMSTGSYVLGLEPANCPVIEGRATAREQGVLPMLEPGESRRYRLTFALRDL
jgi:hypothetical protein